MPLLKFSRILLETPIMTIMEYLINKRPLLKERGETHNRSRERHEKRYSEMIIYIPLLLFASYYHGTYANVHS